MAVFLPSFTLAVMRAGAKMRFGLRTLMTLTTALCVILGMFHRQATKQHAAVHEIELAGGNVTYGDSLASTALPRKVANSVIRDYCSNVVAVEFRSDCRPNIRYPRSMSGPPGPKCQPWYPDPAPDQTMRLSDAMLQQIASLRHVEVLYLAETDVDDADLATFRSMKELRQLSLGKCVSEVAAKELQRALPHTRVEF